MRRAVKATSATSYNRSKIRIGNVLQRKKPPTTIGRHDPFARIIQRSILARSGLGEEYGLIGSD